MPFERSRYPSNWARISREARKRAGSRCERCGVRNGARILRSRADGAMFVYVSNTYELTTPDDRPLRWDDLPEGFGDAQPIRVVLTVAHIGAPHADGTPGDPEDKMDCRPVNLQALCQRCHLRLDVDEHRRTRARKRAERARGVGQMALFEED